MTSKERLAIAQRIMQEDAEIQRRYDAETGHGTLPRLQSNWARDVSRQLASLRQHAQ
jgi:hypothetical protein